MNLNDLFNEEKVRLDPKCWTGKKIGNPKTKMKGGVRVNNCVPAESINEFAPPGGDDREPNEEEILRQLAAQWWLGTEQQMAKAQQTLAAMGWEIGQNESGDDDAGVFLIRAGDANGNSYMAFNHSDLEDLAEGLTEMDKSQTPPGRDGSNDSDAGKKEYTAKATTAKKVAKDGEKILNKELNKKQGVAEEYELAGVGVAYELGRRAYKQGMTIRDNPYSATREARKNDEWAKGLERGKHDANDARHFRSSVREQAVAEDQLDEKSVSQAQFRTMAAAAHNPEFAKKVGISRDVAKEFHSADKSSNYKKLPDRTTEGWKDVVAGGALALGALGAGAQTMPNMNVQQVELANKYYNALVQRATEDGRELDTRTLNFLKAKAQDAAALKLQQASPQKQQGFPTQGSERRVAKDAGQFESQGMAEGKPKEKEADYGDNYQDMVARVKKLAGLGPLKTVYDPTKRVYRNVPTAVQPKK